MARLDLDVRLDGRPEPIGTLTRDDRSNLSFSYAPEYVARKAAFPLSLSLPIQEQPFGDAITRPFFDNLLQERGGVLEQVIAREGIERADIAGILLHLGKDCPGAISVLPEGAPPAKVPGDYQRDYIPYPDEKIEAIVAALHHRERLPQDFNDPSPLAGVQSKIAVTLLPDGRLAEPRPGLGAPTTHILKVPDRGHLSDPRLELEALSLSRRLDETCDGTLMQFGEIPALLVTRFDRELNEEDKVVRIHQEDFAQALGLPAELKYQRRGREGRIFDAAAIAGILARTARPAEDTARFLNATIFDLLIGNVDAHAKNFALLYSEGPRPVLAPRYDLLPTRLDATLTDQLSYAIGEAKTLDEIRPEDFDRFLEILGRRGKPARRRLIEESVTDVSNTLAAELDRVQRQGMKSLADLIAANIRMLLGALGFPVPQEAAGRDAYYPRGAGGR